VLADALGVDDTQRHRLDQTDRSVAIAGGGVAIAAAVTGYVPLADHP
jgi:hypothetical protein